MRTVKVLSDGSQVKRVQTGTGYKKTSNATLMGFFSLSISLKTTKINNKQTERRMGSDPQHYSLG